MYEISKLDTHANAHDLVRAYKHLTPDLFQECLYGIGPSDHSESTIVAIGATFHNEPIGLLIACYKKLPFLEVDLIYLFVHPEHRKQYIGTKLFQKMEQEAYSLGGRFFKCFYPKDEPFTPSLEKIFESQKWLHSYPHLIRCHYDLRMHAQDLRKIPWMMTYAKQLPEGYEEFLWKDLTEIERKEILKQRNDHAFISSVSPLRNKEMIEWSNSLGLRYKDAVIGWMVTHRLTTAEAQFDLLPKLFRDSLIESQDMETISYAALYIDENVHHRGLVMAKLIIDAINLQRNQPHSWAILEMPVTMVPKLYVNFVERRFVPYANKVTRIAQAWKSLPIAVPASQPVVQAF